MGANFTSVSSLLLLSGFYDFGESGYSAEFFELDVKEAIFTSACPVFNLSIDDSF